MPPKGSKRSKKEGDSASKRQKTKSVEAPTEGHSSAASTETEQQDTLDKSRVFIRRKLQSALKKKFSLAYSFLPFSSSDATNHDDECAHRTSETIIRICRVLELSYSVALTALVYLQMYKNSSRYFRDGENSASSEGDATTRDLKQQDMFLIAGGCILIAWKYREDDNRVSRSSRKIFELSTAIYKIFVAQSEKGPTTPSVSSWMLRDEGLEINKLKNQLIQQESHLLQSLDYQIGPISLPNRLIPAYVRRFLIAICGDIADLQDASDKMENLVGILLLECYRTQVCMDYNPADILIACIFKAVCILSVAGECTTLFTPNPPEKDFLAHGAEMEAKLKAFVTSLGPSFSSIDRITQCMWDMRRYSQLFKGKKPS